MPVTPVLPCERSNIQDLLSQHHRRSAANSNQHGSIDFDAAAVHYNSLCNDEMTKPVAERKRYFQKLHST
jgi:hypothetical protein